MAACVLVVGAGCFFYIRYRHVKPAARDLVPRPVASAVSPGVSDRADSLSSANFENSTPSPLPHRDQTGLKEPRTLRPPSPEERRQMREEILKGVNLTAEQRKKVDAIYKQYGDSLSPDIIRRRMEAIGRVLTPAQREVAYGMMRKRIKAYISDRLKMLSPDERAKFMQKLDERFEQRRREIEGAILSQSPPR